MFATLQAMINRAKALSKRLLPPVVFELLQASYALGASKTDPPRWHQVRSGVLRDQWLFVRDRGFFARMVAGDHEACLFQRLQRIDLKSHFICDVGAHIGYHTMAFAALVGAQGRVVAFEPNPYNLARLWMHVRRNSELATCIEIMPLALSDRSGTTRFYYSANVDNATSSGSYLEASAPPLTAMDYRHAGFQQGKVVTTTLDELFPDADARAVALIKIDVEGAECLVLDGGQRLIQRDRPLLLVEVHSVATMLGLAQRLLGIGYEFEALEIASNSRCFVMATPQ